MLQKDQEPPMSERQRRMIDEAEKSCARLVAIVAELSDIGKLDSGSVKLAQQPLDLFSLVEKVAELVHEAEERDVHLKLIGPSNGATITGDTTRLRTAIDAIFRAILRVGDEGRVQEAYDQEPGPFDDKRGGLGLALPLARRVIEGHGGRIWSPANTSGSIDSPDPLSRGSAIISFPLRS
jgi:signal transduction histidine kinase